MKTPIILSPRLSHMQMISPLRMLLRIKSAPPVNIVQLCGIWGFCLVFVFCVIHTQGCAFRFFFFRKFVRFEKTGDSLSWHRAGSGCTRQPCRLFHGRLAHFRAPRRTMHPSHHKLTGVDGVGILVRNLNAKLLLNSHDDLDSIERVEAEVVGKVSGGLDLYRKLGLDRNGDGMDERQPIACNSCRKTRTLVVSLT